MRLKRPLRTPQLSVGKMYHHPAIFPQTEFLAHFPEFGDEKVYPPENIMLCGRKAMLHITEDVCDMPMQGPYRFYALFLMTAHILLLDKQYSSNTEVGSNSSGGSEFKAVVGSVTVEKTKPNSFTVDDWSYWLNQTPYGRELLAYLDTRAPLGVFLNTTNDSVRDLI